MQLLQDTFIIENLQVLTEGKNSDVMKIKGVFGRCNEKNNNGRIYPTSVLQSQLEKVSPLISERRLCGELDHPQNDTVKLSNASHLITHLEMKGHELIGEAELLKTPAGMTAQALINGGVKIGISSRGMGTLSEDGNGDKVVNEDFKLVTFDLVADPSTRGAYPCLSESTEGKFARETQSKLQKEDNFVTLLKSKMRQAYQPFIEEQSTATESANQRANRLRTQSRKVRGAGGGAERRELAAMGIPVASEVQRGHKTAGRISASTEQFKLVKSDGHWHRMAYALQDRLHEIAASQPGEELARDLLGDDPEERGVGMAASERRRALRQHHRGTLRTAKKMERFKTKEGARRIGKFAKAERKAAGKASKQKTGTFWRYGTDETEAKSGAKAAKITAKGTAKAAKITGKGEGQAQAAKEKAIAKGDVKAKRIRTGGRNIVGFRRKGLGELESAEGERVARSRARATDTTARGEAEAARTTARGEASAERTRARGAASAARTTARGERGAHRIKHGTEVLGVTVQKGEKEREAQETERAAKVTRKGEVAQAGQEGRTERAEARAKLKTDIHGRAIGAARDVGAAATEGGEALVGGAAKAISGGAEGAGKVTGAALRGLGRRRSATRARSRAASAKAGGEEAAWKGHEGPQEAPTGGEGPVATDKARIEREKAEAHAARRASDPARQGRRKGSEMSQMAGAARREDAPGEHAEAAHASLERGLQRRGTEQLSKARGGVTATTSTPAKGQETFEHPAGERGAADPTANERLRQQRKQDARSGSPGKASRMGVDTAGRSQHPLGAGPKPLGSRRGKILASLAASQDRPNPAAERRLKQLKASTEYHRLGSLIAEILQ